MQIQYLKLHWYYCYFQTNLSNDDLLLQQMFLLAVVASLFPDYIAQYFRQGE